MTTAFDVQDKRYLELIINKINVCKTYKPKFGQGKNISFEEFKTLYGTDAFYSWFGLDNPLMYAAHRAAGGITSLYRQIGTGCEQLFRQILCDHLHLTDSQARWSYEIKTLTGNLRRLSLDGRIQLSDLQSEEDRRRIAEWMARATSRMGVDVAIIRALKGSVFEVRQGYKSKDSKRQNADIANAGTAIAQGYLPVVAMLSTQIDGDVADRYVSAGWLLLRGYVDDSPISSTYAFCDQILNYDLAGFLARNAATLSATVQQVLETLLTPEEYPPTRDEPNSRSEIQLADELEVNGEDSDEF